MKQWLSAFGSSVRCRLAALIVIALLPALGLIAYQVQQDRSQAEARAAEKTLLAAQSVARNTEEAVEQSRHLLATLAALISERGDLSDAAVASWCSSFLSRMLGPGDIYANLGASLAAGEMACSALPFTAPLSTLDRSWYQGVMRTGEFYVGDFQIGRITGRPTVNAGYPARDSTGMITGVVFAALDLQTISQFVATLNLPEGSVVNAIAGDGTILLRYPDPEQWVGKSAAGTSLMSTVMSLERPGATVEEGLDGVRRLFGTGVPLLPALGGRSPVVSAGIPPAAAFAEVSKTEWISAGAIAAVLGLTLAATAGGSHYLIMVPLRSLRRAADRLSRGEFSTRTGLRHDAGEVGTLARAFDTMASSVERRHREVTSLNEVALATAASLQVEDVLYVGLAAALKTLNADTGNVLLLDQRDQVLHLVHSHGHLPETIDALRRIRVGEGVAGQAVLRREAVALEAGSHPQDRLLAVKTAAGLKAVVAAPLISSDLVLGALSVGSRRERAFQQEEIELLKSIAAQLGGAVHRAQQFSEIRRQNEELEQQVALRTSDLEAAVKELEAFSYSVSHDLRAPLRGIDGFSLALLEDYGDRLDSVAREYLARVRAASQLMGHLIDDLLKLSRVTRAVLDRQRVDLTALSRSIADELRRREPERRVEFVIAGGMVVQADPGLMRVAMENLLANAWKFTSKKESARIEVGPALAESNNTFFVKDDGAGFDMNYAGKLFAPFQRLHGRHEFEGTGVGLATVQRIITRHGGRVWAEGAVEQGATFYFTL